MLGGCYSYSSRCIVDLQAKIPGLFMDGNGNGNVNGNNMRVENINVHIQDPTCRIITSFPLHPVLSNEFARDNPDVVII